MERVSAVGGRLWYLYIVRCRDGMLYTGIATDVARRLEEHAGGSARGARYLRGRGPLRLVLEHPVGARGLALCVEARVKRLSRTAKEELAHRGDLLTRLVEECAAVRAAVPTRNARSEC